MKEYKKTIKRKHLNSIAIKFDELEYNLVTFTKEVMLIEYLLVEIHDKETVFYIKRNNRIIANIIISGKQTITVKVITKYAVDFNCQFGQLLIELKEAD